MTYARLALRHPLEGYYPIDGKPLIAQPSLLADYWRMQTQVLLLCSYQGPLYCDQDSNDHLISNLSNSFRPGPLIRKRYRRQLSTGSDHVISALGSLQPGTSEVHRLL